ncbi:MAG: hypothetical protein CBD56_01675 [Candidatus Pelagibacter sp. TMED196]|nr:MAG: hypothetical protein CBD56_01675 [Candidatus Pelagibacter sp. TMED196]|tara:strand:+ start:1935 stop:2510 length:576 start_codon:yes stop_codon:yes gene_type:complete
MTFKKIYFFISRTNEINLDYVKKTGAILILRNLKETNIKKLKRFARNCKRNKITFFVANNLKLLFLLKTNNLYISAWNKQYYKHIQNFNNNIKIIGSAHNANEIREKIRQGCSQIFISRIFKTNYKFKKSFLGSIKFNLLTKNFKSRYVALGGINYRNFNQIKNLNIIGCALSLDKKKAGNYLPAFFKKTY